MIIKVYKILWNNENHRSCIIYTRSRTETMRFDWIFNAIEEVQKTFIIKWLMSLFHFA